MTSNVLRIISDSMSALNLEYDFVTYRKKPIVYPYFVGSYTESEAMNEDGMQECSFRLTGFTRGEWQTLEEAKAKIETYFGRVGGKTVMVDDGSAVAIFYANSLIVPTGEADLKSIQINLSIKEWSVS